MSRKKGKTKGGKRAAKNTPLQTPSKRHSSQSWLVQDATPRFSLADEARWQASHRTSAFEAGKRLRHLPIHFLSAGHLEGTLKKRLPAIEPAALESEDDSLASCSPPSTPGNTAAMAHMAIRSPSPVASEASSSSADEVVFRGRRQPPLVPVASQSIPRAIATAYPIGMERTTPRPATRTEPPAPEAVSLSDAPRVSTFARTPLLTVASTGDHISVIQTETRASVELSIRVNKAHAPDHEVDSDTDSVVQDQFARRCGGKPAWEGTTTAWQHRSKPNIGWLPVEARPNMDAFLRGDVNPREAAMADYMQNVDDFGLTGDMMDASSFARREMDLDAGSHNDWESASGSQHEGEETSDVEGKDSWDSDMLQDLEGISTSSDVMNTVVRILSKRTRQSGLHYLCVYEGSVTDDARWLPASYLTGATEKDLIRLFEEEAKQRELAMHESSDSAGDKEEEEDDSEEDELDDETIARVLQKQEELGLGSDEVLLYGGDEFFEGTTGAKASYGGFGRPNKKRQARMRANRGTTFPSASAMADALAMDPYGGFDIMDTDRPSLKPKKKERRGQMAPELEDPDLNEQLQNAWEADRAKKRMKKAERGELRQRGLLGRKGKSANIKVKYKGGFVMDDVLEEIREFLFDDRQSLSLPPMDAHRRATIHQASADFGLSSRSRGDGQNRFTILSKTSRTTVFTDDDFDRVVQSIRFQKRLRRPSQSQMGSGSAKASTFRSGKCVRAQVGYRDGETVGANAPELGPENRGHALMMKMGWSKGMGLGAGDNKGILQPIPHTVKTNKAGLQ